MGVPLPPKVVKRVSSKSVTDPSSRGELAEAWNQVRAALSRMEKELERTKAVLSAVRLGGGEPVNNNRDDEKPKTEDLGMNGTGR